MAEENFEEQNMDGVHEENFDEQNVGVVPEENFDEQNLDSVPHENFDGQNVGGENSQPPEAVKKTEHDTKADDIKKWPGWPGENVFRMLIPVQKVGGIIGRKGEFIKRMCQETKARIKILEGPQGATERAVLPNLRQHFYHKVASH